MKTTTVILILLGIATASQAQTTNPPASRNPNQSRDAFIAESKDPFANRSVAIVKSKDGHAFIAEPGDGLISSAPSAPASGPFAASGNVRIIRTQDGSVFVEDVSKGKQPATDPTLGAGNGNVRILNRDAAVELARDLAKKGRYDEARALLNDEMQTATPPKSADDPNLALVFPKDANPGAAPEPDASQRLSLTADPAATGPLTLTKPVAPAPLVTRLYPLKDLITKSPTEIDDDAHNKKADDAYKAKTEALNKLWKIVLEHSEPAGAAFTFSSDAGVFVVKATDAQHELLQEAAQLLEKNQRK